MRRAKPRAFTLTNDQVGRIEEVVDRLIARHRPDATTTLDAAVEAVLAHLADNLRAGIPFAAAIDDDEYCGLCGGRCKRDQRTDDNPPGSVA